MEQALSAIGATVDAELARVRVASAAEAARAVVRDVIERLVTVLEHTDAGSRVAFEVEIDAGVQVPLSCDALSEIAGALLENAVRHARRRVRVIARRSREGGNPGAEPLGASRLDSRLRGNDEGEDSGRRGNDVVELIIEDDGAGIAGERFDDVLLRGARLDEAGGTGLGLAIARDLVAATHGTLALGQSPLGGLAVRLAWALSRSASPV
jgi:signal transduction histidine kinase